jgi:hypothetical protein
MQNEYPNARRPFVLCPTKPISTTVSPTTSEARKAHHQQTPVIIYAQSNQFVKGRGKSSGSAPSADTISDTTKRLEVVPARELVVFRGGRDVRADDADGEVWDFGDGDFGAVEL